ncbi:MAG TPA: PleD family two-component system response regulator [Allocoleopsis sp.]
MLNAADRGTVLIVDDSPTNLGLLCDCLTSAGFRVLTAQGGESAIETVQQDYPDVILLDIIMPGIDGFETCRRLKAHESTRNIPIIFMTALSQTAVVLKGFELGAVDYITKPTQQDIVLARVTTHLTLQKLKRHLQEQNAQLQQEIQQRQQAEAALLKANQELQRLVRVDSLTQLANRRHFDECLSQAWRILRREQLPLSLLLCDVDFFKVYNDRNGHQAGDECLREVARAIKRAVKRPADLVARYGGEEFAVILPNTNGEGALRVAEGIRLSLHNQALTHPQSPIGEYVTLSVGVSSTIPGFNASFEELVAAADRGLYQAKESGRDRAVFVPVEHGPSLNTSENPVNRRRAIAAWQRDMTQVGGVSVSSRPSLGEGEGVCSREMFTGSEPVSVSISPSNFLKVQVRGDSTPVTPDSSATPEPGASDSTGSSGIAPPASS